MSEVIVVATFTIRDGLIDEAIAEFESVIAATHDEPGCITYALHRDNANPSRLVMVERWESQDALNSHIQAPHMAKLGEFAAEMLSEPPMIAFCSPLGIGQAEKSSLQG
jgi:quinol monooxygenase YgiN